MIAFPLPTLTPRDAVVAPRTWGCHACGEVLRRESCCQRARCWRFDDRGERTLDRLDAPAHVPAAHCASCCPHAAVGATTYTFPTITEAPGRAA